MTPRRIQRKRTKGWRMPPNTVYVGRPTKWGNPYWHQEKFHSRDIALRLFRMTATGFWLPDELPASWPEEYRAITYADHSRWLDEISGHPVDAARIELRGKNLACWCPLDHSCHADVLLELANR